MYVRKALALAVLALCACAVWVGTAGASEVLIEPAGNITRTGSISVSTGEGTITCNVTMRGSLARSATGTLTAGPSPEFNPLIGRTSTAITKTCMGGELTILNGDPPKYVYAHNITEPEKWLMFELPYEILIEQLPYKCLYRMRVDYTYNSRTGTLTLTGTTVLTRTALFGGLCPASIRIEGVLTLTTETGRFPFLSRR